MNNYYPLAKRLSQGSNEEVTLTFSEIEDILGSKLPDSAYRYRAWWANDISHTQANAWMEAGYSTSDCPDLLTSHKVRFSKNHDK